MNLCPLKKEDIEILEDIALGLGKSDSQSQINIINPATERIKAKLKESTEKEAKLGKMYKSLGFAAGIIIVIMFI
jgi:stage III sporulation protein AB